MTPTQRVHEWSKLPLVDGKPCPQPCTRCGELTYADSPVGPLHFDCAAFRTEARDRTQRARHFRADVIEGADLRGDQSYRDAWLKAHSRYRDRKHEANAWEAYFEDDRANARADIITEGQQQELERSLARARQRATTSLSPTVWESAGRHLAFGHTAREVEETFERITRTLWRVDFLAIVRKHGGQSVPPATEHGDATLVWLDIAEMTAYLDGSAFTAGLDRATQTVVDLTRAFTAAPDRTTPAPPLTIDDIVRAIYHYETILPDGAE